jgi:hypothetical protein
MRILYEGQSDGWTSGGKNITSPDTLDIIRRILDNEGPIIVEHHGYRAASSPDRLIFEDYDLFLKYINEHSYAGDLIVVWSFEAICKKENQAVEGYCPDDNGLIPNYPHNE